MARFTPKKIDISKMNGGFQYIDGRGIVPSFFNECAEGVAYSNEATEALSQAPDVSEIDGSGAPTVELVDTTVNGRTYKKLKFSNLKGEQALAFNETLVFEEVVEVGAYLSSEYQYFNRTPKIGDIFIYPARTSDKSKSFLVQGRVVALGTYVDYTAINVLLLGGENELFVRADINSIENPKPNTYYVQKNLPKTFAYSMYDSDYNGNFWTKQINDSNIVLESFLPKGQYILKFSIGGVEYTTNCRCNFDEETGVLCSDNAQNRLAPFKLLGEGDHTNYDVNQLNSVMFFGDGIILFSIYGYGDYARGNGYILPDVHFISLTSNADGIIYFYDGTEFNMVGAKTSALPSVTASDVGKILRVNANGEWVAESLPSAEGVSF